MNKDKTIQQKMNFIKRFCSISVTRICNELGTDRSNVVSGKCKEEYIHLVYAKLCEELGNMIKEVYKNE